MMFAGLTIANVLGVPLGTLLGQQLGWRSTFWAITAIGARRTGRDGRLWSPQHAARGRRPAPRAVGAFGHPQVWLSLLITVLGFGGMFGAFTYIAYTLTEVSGFASETVPWLLILFGVGLFAGNCSAAGSPTARCRARWRWCSGALVLVLTFFALTASSPVLTVVSLVLMGLFGFATVPGLQMRIMEYAEQAPTVASGANIAAFNVGNALGAWLGGITITAGLGYTSPIWVGAALTLGALLVLGVATRMEVSARDRVVAAP